MAVGPTHLLMDDMNAHLNLPSAFPASQGFGITYYDARAIYDSYITKRFRKEKRNDVPTKATRANKFRGDQAAS
jgi:hypothetical protein